jgi:hypothetical protein
VPELQAKWAPLSLPVPVEKILLREERKAKKVPKDRFLLGVGVTACKSLQILCY